MVHLTDVSTVQSTGPAVLEISPHVSGSGLSKFKNRSVSPSGYALVSPWPTWAAAPEQTTALLGSWTVPPSPDTKSPRSYLLADVAVYVLVTRMKIVSVADWQTSGAHVSPTEQSASDAHVVTVPTPLW